MPATAMLPRPSYAITFTADDCVLSKACVNVNVFSLVLQSEKREEKRQENQSSKQMNDVEQTQLIVAMCYYL